MYWSLFKYSIATCGYCVGYLSPVLLNPFRAETMFYAFLTLIIASSWNPSQAPQDWVKCSFYELLQPSVPTSMLVHIHPVYSK